MNEFSRKKMKLKISFNHLSLLLFFILMSSQYQLLALGCHAEERNALLSFKSSLQDPSNRLSSWQIDNNSRDCCAWHGIQCSNDTLWVVSVDLHNTSLVGTIFWSLFTLVHLEYLDLSFNYFQQSQIPKQFSNLEKLTQLNLSSSGFSGMIPPGICNLNRINILNLSHNNLTGSIPSCLSKLQTLSDLDLSGNKLQGALPRLVFANISNKVSLNLSNNNFDGPLPLLPLNLSRIDLSKNKFSGEISTEAGTRLSNARVVFLSSNELVGSIPFSLCTNLIWSRFFPWPGPATLDLSNNHLSGSIPSSIGDCRSLISLQLSNNNLAGNVPNELEQIEDLRYLQLNDNKLNGSFPSCIQMIRWLEVLNLGNNSFEGTIPSFLGLMDGLTIISLRSNKFSGSIPEKITELENLRILDLSVNNLSGSVPRKIGNLKMLISRPNETFDLGFFGDIQLLMVIKGIVTKMERLYSYSSGLDLSCNILDGVIPEEIAQLKGLSMLNLSHNHLSGVIPKNVGNMTGLGSLDLSFNKLSGEIPKSLTSIDSLGYLNLSYNSLSGKIPRGDHFDTLSTDCSAFVGNDLSCGFLTKTTRGSNPEAASKVEADNQEDAKEKLLFYAIVALGVAVGFWGMFFILLVRKETWWFGYWRFVDSVATRIARFFLRN